MDDDERKKANQLIREKKGDGDNTGVGWMYSANKIDRDDYLLGKRVQKLSELDEEAKERSPKADIGALFDEETIQKRCAVDMRVKMREDPLFAIKRKEDDEKRKILENPVKMKLLKQNLEEMNKKKKSKKKHRRDDDSSEEDELLNQYLNILRQKKGGKPHDAHQSPHDAHQSRGHHESRGHKELGDAHRRSRDDRGDDRAHDQSRDERSRDDRSRDDRSRDDRSRDDRQGDHRSRNERQEDHRSRDETSRDDKSRDHRSRDHRVDRHDTSRRSRSRSPKRRHKEASGGSSSRQEEMERKRREMMDNAKAWDAERKQKVESYKKEEKMEAEQHSSHQGGADFIAPMMAEHAGKSSVEERLRRNRHNIQRTQAALDSSSYSKR